MTEEEAKSKWCPHMLPHKVKDPSACWGWDGKCLGSACMMWRKINMPQDYPTYKITFDGEQMLSTQVDIVDYGGYCGLGGKP